MLVWTTKQLELCLAEEIIEDISAQNQGVEETGSVYVIGDLLNSVAISRCCHSSEGEPLKAVIWWKQSWACSEPAQSGHGCPFPGGV